MLVLDPPSKLNNFVFPVVDLLFIVAPIILFFAIDSLRKRGWLLYFNFVLVIWLLLFCVSSSQCSWLVHGLWLWHFQAPMLLNLFHAQLNLAQNFDCLQRLKYRHIKKYLALSLSDDVFIMLINVVGILTFKSRINFVLS